MGQDCIAEHHPVGQGIDLACAGVVLDEQGFVAPGVAF
jgi:hypothetical protein